MKVNVLEYLFKTKTKTLFFAILFFQIAIALFLNFLDIDFGENSLGGKTILHIFVLVVIFAPIFETLIFNMLPVKAVNFFTKNRLAVILLSSLVFSLMHTYSIAYMIMTYFGGIGLNAFYLIIEERKGFLKAVGLTVLLHSIYNLFGFLLIEIFHVSL